MCSVADETSSFFGPLAEPQLRNVRRYIGQAWDRRNKTGTADAVLDWKHLSIIESCCVLVSAWESKPNLPTGVLKFNTKWRALKIVCEEDPVVKLDCPFIWSFYLNTLLTQDASLAPGLTLHHLKERYPKYSTDQHDALQAQYLIDHISNFMRSELSTDKLVNQLAAAVQPYTDSSNRLQFPEHTVLGCVHFLKLVTPPELKSGYTAADSASLTEALTVYDGSVHAIVQTLRNCRKQGEPILKKQDLHAVFSDLKLRVAICPLSSRPCSCPCAPMTMTP